MNHNELHFELKKLVQTERKITEQILDLINQCELSRTYAKLGYSSMFEYLHKGLGYSEGSAQRRLSSARLLRELPEIKSDLQNGVLNLTQVAMAQIAIRKEEKVQSKKMDLNQKKEILTQLKNKNTFQSKAVLVEALPSYSPEEANTISPIKDNQVQITLTLSQEQYKQLKEAQDYLSNKVQSTELKDYLLYLTKKVLQQKVPVSPAATATPAVGKTMVATEPTNIQKQRPYISQSLKAEVFRAADFQCQYVSKDNQKRCEATRFLHIDHVQPIALDGATNQENLRVYCQAHNHLAAIEGGLITAG